MSDNAYPFTYKLIFPVSYGSKEIHEIHYRNPKGKDMRSLKIGMNGNMETGEFIDLFARVCDQSPQFFDEISPQDYFALVGVASDFLGGGQPTGERPMNS